MKRTWMLAALMAVPIVARADQPCWDDHFMRAFDPALHHMTCSSFNTPPIIYAATRDSPRHTARILHPSTVAPTRDEKAAYDEVGDIILKMVSTTNAVRMDLPDSIAVYLDSGPDAPENRAAQLRELDAARANHNYARPEECVVAYHYRSADPHRRFDMMHQLFHCMTWTMWDHARLSATDANWWAEGSAEFFASIAYPNMTDVDAQVFHTNETASLFSRGADAVVFFDWYATRPGRLKGLIDIVNELPPGALMVDLYDEVGAHWLELEEAYFDHTIRAPGGAVVPYPNTPIPQLTPVSGTRTVTLRASPYEIHGATLDFAPGHAYEIASDGDADFKWQWSDGAAGAWTEAPTIVHTCHQTRRYRIVMAARNRDVSRSVRITAREEHEADCPCLVGAWQQTAASLARVAERLQSRGIRNARCSFTGGGTLLQFTADFHGGETYQDLTTQCVGQTMSSEGKSSGTGSFTWAQTSATQITMNNAGGAANAHIKITNHGHTSELDTPMPGGSTAAITFRCSRTDLHLEYRSASSLDVFDYVRVP